MALNLGNVKFEPYKFLGAFYHGTSVGASSPEAMANQHAFLSKQPNRNTMKKCRACPYMDSPCMVVLVVSALDLGCGPCLKPLGPPFFQHLACYKSNQNATGQITLVSEAH